MKKSTTTEKKTFADLLRAYEHASTTPAEDASKPLYDLAAAVAFSVLSKVIDPQRKAAAEKEAVSNSGMNPALVSFRRGLVADLDILDKTDRAGKACVDHVAADADLDGLTFSDGMDLAQEAAAAILEETSKAFDREESYMGARGVYPAAGWMETPYKVRRIKRRTVTIDGQGAKWETVDTTPIQEVYRAVRRAIQSSRAVQTDPRNGYSYIEDLTADPESGALETLYLRLGKYADLGGYAVDSNGKTDLYTTDAQAVRDYRSILAALNLTDRQAEIVKLRMRGYGDKAIAAYLGVSKQAVQNARAKIAARAEKIGFTPSLWEEMTANN